jgi:tetratricopeptide (TPR) repeat protein
MAFKANEAQKLANARLELVEQERDRAQAAERQLAALERKQRNRVAIHQAASEYNANMVKQYLANGTPGNVRASGEPASPVIQVKPIGSYWSRSAGDANTISISSRSTNEKRLDDAKFLSDSSVGQADSPQTDFVSDVAFRGPADGQLSRWSFCDDPENAKIEVIVVSDEHACEETLLKSILENQRKAFGGRDIIVARTLEQLGELTSGDQDWEQSEKYFREALEIFKESAPDKKQLAAIRLKLVKALEKQGHLKKVMNELQDLKQSFEQSELHDDVTNLFKKINLNKDASNDSSNPDSD